MSFVTAALRLSDAVTARHIVDEENSSRTERNLIDSVVMCLNSSTWLKACTTVTLPDFFAPIFDGFLQLGHELIGDGAVDQPMVVAESQVDDGADGDGIVAIFVGDNDQGILVIPPTPRIAEFGWLMMRQSENCAELAGIGDRKCRTFHLIRFELLGASPFSQIADPALQTEEIQLVGILQHWNDQAPVERDRDTNIDVAMVADAFAFDGGVNNGKLLQRDNDCARKKRHEGEPGPVALFERRFVFVARDVRCG